MDYKQRNQKLRVLVSRVNKERKKQAKKIDILCNDLIAAHRDFISRLNAVSFAAGFYQSIAGITEMNALLYTAGRLIKDEIPDSSIVFFLRQQESFELHLFESDQPITFEKQRLENFFTDEVVDNVCKSNKVCDIDSLLALGLEGNPALLNKISAVTIPLGQAGPAIGFVLIYRSLENKLTDDEVNQVAAVASGLSRVIQSCLALSHPPAIKSDNAVLRHRRTD